MIMIGDLVAPSVFNGGEIAPSVAVETSGIQQSKMLTWSGQDCESR